MIGAATVGRLSCARIAESRLKRNRRQVAVVHPILDPLQALDFAYVRPI
jgi:hypothetical protein